MWAEGGFEPVVSLYADDFLIHISKVNKFIFILVENVMLLGLFVPKNELYLKGRNIQGTINTSDAIKWCYGTTFLTYFEPQKDNLDDINFSISLG